MTLFPLILAAAVAGVPVLKPTAPYAVSVSSEEKVRLVDLIAAALEAARTEADAVRVDPGADPFDRQSAQTQYAKAVRRVRGCDAALTEIAARPEIMGEGIGMIITDAMLDGDRPCATRLAPLMIERAAEDGYTLFAQMGLRFRAGAILDAAGHAEGKTIMREAEAVLENSPHGHARWETRFNAITAYPEGTPGHRIYLEHLADRIAAEGVSVPSSTRMGIFALYGLYNRCDLIARVVGPDPKACEAAKADGKRMYVDPPSGMMMMESARNFDMAIGLEEPWLNADAIAEARRDSLGWRRMTKLLVFISACQKRLAEARGLQSAGRP
jgi:hypothetical protein